MNPAEETMRANSDTFHKRMLLAIGSLLVASVGAVVWGTNRGFGFGDEGLYALSARHPEDFRENVSAVYDYTGALFEVVGHDLVGFRLIGIGLVLLSGLIVWLGLTRYLAAQGARFPFEGLYTLGLVGAGTVLHYQWAFTTPSNYTLGAIALNGSVGATLGMLAVQHAKVSRWRASLCWGVLGGLFIGLAFFNRFVAGLGLLALLLMLLTLWRGRRSARIGGASGLIGGALIWAAMDFTIVHDLNELAERFLAGWNLFQAFGRHVPESKMLIYTMDGLTLLAAALVNFLPAHVLAIAALVASRVGTEKWRSWLTVIALSMAAVLSIWPAVNVAGRASVGAATPFYISFALGWIILLFWLWLASQPNDSKDYTTDHREAVWNKLLILCLLAAAPVAATVGTANPIYNNTGFYSAPWYAAIFLLVRWLAVSSSLDVRRTVALILLPVVAFSASQIIQGSIFDASQIPTPLTQQSVETAVGQGAAHILLDRESHDVVAGLRALGSVGGFAPGDDVLAMNYVPGLVYAMGGRAPGHPALLLGNPNFDRYSKIALSFANPERLQRAFVLLSFSDLAPASAFLQEFGLAFPDRYRLLGAAGRYTLWAPAP